MKFENFEEAQKLHKGITIYQKKLDVLTEIANGGLPLIERFEFRYLLPNSETKRCSLHIGEDDWWYSVLDTEEASVIFDDLSAYYNRKIKELKEKLDTL